MPVSLICASEFAMAGRRAYVRRARHWIANRGWRGFLDEVWYRIRLLAQGRPIPGRENGSKATHPFDLQNGVDTGGLVWGESLAEPNSRDAAYWATGYYGISPSAFTAAMQRLHLPWREFSFVDAGCGKGRALMLAMRFPFRQVLGVELSPELATAAKRNVETFAAEWRCPDVPVHVVCGDATTMTIPDGPVAVFLYHPFAAPVMERFLAHLVRAAQASAREIVLLYANPELHQLLSRTPGVQWLWKETFELTPEEGAADRFGSYGEQFSAYRITPA